MKFLITLVIALSLTIAWQASSLNQQADDLKSVDHKQAVIIPPQAT